MKGCHSQRRRFSLQALCVVPSPTSEEEIPVTEKRSSVWKLSSGRPSGSPPPLQDKRLLHPSTASKSRGSTNTSEDPIKSHYKVVVLGSARVGKTSLVGQFWYAAFSPRYRPTVDDMHMVEMECNGLNLRLDILDTGGSYAFPAMRDLAIKGADGFILVCALDDPASLQEVELARDQIFEMKNKSVPIVVVVNKTDLIDEAAARGEDSKVNDAQSKSFLSLEMVESLVTCDWGHGFVAASAKDNVNVVQVFQELFTQAKSRVALSPAVRKRRQSLPGRGAALSASGISHLSHLQQLSIDASKEQLPNQVSKEQLAGTSKRNSCTVS